MAFSADIIARNLHLTKNFSSCGPDNIPYIALKAGGHLLLEQLSRLFQLSFNSGSVPSQWKISCVTPIFKKGNRRDPGNYRPVSLTCCIYKVMEACIREVMWK